MDRFPARRDTAMRWRRYPDIPIPGCAVGVALNAAAIERSHSRILLIQRGRPVGSERESGGLNQNEDNQK